MKKEQLKLYRQLLVKKKAELMSSVSVEERGGREAVTVEAKDFGDMATEAYDQEMNFTMSDAGRKSLKELDDAILRVDGGTYGTCERCQTPIDETRLQAVPQASMCISCQETSEREGHR